MEKIVVAYWHSKFNDLKFEHNQEFEYSKHKRNSIIDYITERGYSVMLRPFEKQLTIWIDRGRFGQR